MMLQQWISNDPDTLRNVMAKRAADRLFGQTNSVSGAYYIQYDLNQLL